MWDVPWRTRPSYKIGNTKFMIFTGERDLYQTYLLKDGRVLRETELEGITEINYLRDNQRNASVKDWADALDTLLES